MAGGLLNRFHHRNDVFRDPHLQEDEMASNEPTGDNRRIGAVKKRTQLKTKVLGESAWTKRDKRDGTFMAVKKSAKKFKGVRREKAA